MIRRAIFIEPVSIEVVVRVFYCLEAARFALGKNTCEPVHGVKLCVFPVQHFLDIIRYDPIMDTWQKR